MEKKSHNGSAGTLKENIDAISKKSKETIRNIIDSSSKQFEKAFEHNRFFVETLEKQALIKDMTDGTILSELKNAFNGSVELSEEAIDAIIDIQSAQLQAAIEFNGKLTEVIKNIQVTEPSDRDELLEIISTNFEESTERLFENAKKMTDIYHKHISLTSNFNERFAQNINHQIQALARFQNKNVNMFNDWASHWWKTAQREEAMV